jgi:uncharacterized protein DUF4293
MWQRIQTIFLIIVVVSMITSVLFPIWVYKPGTENSHELYALHYTIKENGVLKTQYFPYSTTAVFAIATITLAITSIGNYKNRLLQRKLGALNSLFMALTVAASVYFANQLIHLHEIEGQHYSLGLYLPIIAVIANFLANRFIMRDEKLVKDSDRLR